MNDHETIDRQLRESLAGEPPRLSPGFDSRLQRRLQQHRPNPMRSLVLWSYASAALIGSVWMMRSADLGWTPIAVALAAPLIALATVYRMRVAS